MMSQPMSAPFAPYLYAYRAKVILVNWRYEGRYSFPSPSLIGSMQSVVRQDYLSLPTHVMQLAAHSSSSIPPS